MTQMTQMTKVSISYARTFAMATTSSISPFLRRLDPVGWRSYPRFCSAHRVRGSLPHRDVRQECRTYGEVEPFP